MALTDCLHEPLDELVQGVSGNETNRRTSKGNNEANDEECATVGSLSQSKEERIDECTDRRMKGEPRPVWRLESASEQTLRFIL